MGLEGTFGTKPKMTHEKSFLDLGTKQTHVFHSDEIQRTNSVHLNEPRVIKAAQKTKEGGPQR
jgi:hypothetical protein